jgi:hypothetical protein
MFFMSCHNVSNIIIDLTIKLLLTTSCTFGEKLLYNLFYIIDVECESMKELKIEIIKIVCDRCKNTWIPRVKQPIKCPKCGHRDDSSKINKKRKLTTCAQKGENKQ